MMTYQKFLKLAGDYPEFTKTILYQWTSREKEVLNPIEIQIEWDIGGARGGNCWGDDACEYTSEEEEPEFKELDTILQKIVPKITYLEHKKLSSEVIEEDSRTDREYYGNYTNSSIKKIKLRKLYDTLVEMKLI